MYALLMITSALCVAIVINAVICVLLSKT